MKNNLMQEYFFMFKNDSLSFKYRKVKSFYDRFLRIFKNISVVGFRSPVEDESTYWTLVNSLNLQNELMDVHQSDISKILQYLMHAPPYGHVWHKAFFLVGPGAGP